MNSDHLLALTVIGSDRPGIVAGVAKVLYELGCNLEDATSTILRGHFSMMLVIRAPRDIDAAGLESRLEAVSRELGVLVAARPLQEADVRVAPPTHVVSVYGADRPGIVFRVAELLSELGANITDLTSRLIGSEDRPVYALLLEVAVDDPSELQDRLERLREELSVEVTVHRAEEDLL